MSTLVTNIISCVAKNDIPFLEKFIATGIFETLVRGSGSSLNNVTIFNITNCDLISHYGFTCEEIET